MIYLCFASGQSYRRTAVSSVFFRSAAKCCFFQFVKAAKDEFITVSQRHVCRWRPSSQELVLGGECVFHCAGVFRLFTYQTQIKKRGTYFLLEPRVTTPTLSNKLFHAVATAFGNLFLKVLPRLLEDFVVNEVQE